jgi:glycerophosphoryl diester phosphodiesterase
LAFGLQGINLNAWYGNWILRETAKAHLWGYMTNVRWLPKEKLLYAHQLGVKFCPRVKDNEDLINGYIDAGVDGFETDNVPFIRRCIEKKGFSLWPLPNINF